MRILVTGGTRSGKSDIAERLLPAHAPVTYVATAEVGDEVGDEEMRDRVQRHRDRRSPAWRTVETGAVGRAIADAPGSVLVDSVGLWVTRRMGELELWEEGDLRVLVAEAGTWFDGRADDRTVVVVAEQVGQGTIAADAATRRWVDVVGEVTGTLSAAADRVLLAVAGRAVELPGPADAGWTPESPTTEAPTGEIPIAESPTAEIPTADDAVLWQHGDGMVPPGALDMAVNVIDQAPPAHVLRAIDRAHNGAYPDQGTAREAVAVLTGLTEQHVVLLAGAAEAFWLLPHALRPRRAAVVHPTFTAPEAALHACGVPVARVARDRADSWRLRPDRVPDDADLVVIGNPNNPTGTLDDPADIVSLCRPGRTVVVDEAFMDFVTDDRSSLAGRVDLSGLVVIRSVTKLWSVPGLRAGWLVAAPDVARRLRRHQQPWPVSAQALAVIATAADDEQWRIQTAEGVAHRRRAMVARLSQIPDLLVHDGAANFVLLQVPSGPAVHRALLARGIAVRPSTFPLLPPEFLRVTVRDADVVEDLARTLTEIL